MIRTGNKKFFWRAISVSPRIGVVSSRFNFASLVVAQSNSSGKLNKSFYKILTAAAQFKDETHLLLAGGDNLDTLVQSVKSTLTTQTAESLSKAVKYLLQKNSAYTRVIVDSSSLGKDVLPRLAASFGSQPITDIIKIHEDLQTFSRPCYAGNAIVTLKSTDKIKFLSFRATNFEEIPPTTDSSKAITAIEKVDLGDSLANLKTVHIKDEIVKSERPELTAARIVVSGGRGLKSGENFKLLEDLAGALGEAAIGASRAAVDAGYVSNDLQVGQTGKVVAPEIYFAIGISGAIQHLAGMKDSKVIVAINKDSEAPIFEIATYGLVGDLFKIVPELTEKIKALK